MEHIPQRVLRNQSGTILRRAEGGERLVVTVHGRPVAVIGPVESRQWVSADEVRRILSTPADPAGQEEHRQRPNDPPVDPWAR